MAQDSGGYSGYSGDTAADNVSSPRLKSRRVYSEDTQIRAGDNGGYARGYHKLFALLAAWQIPLRPGRQVRQAVFLCIGVPVGNVLICRCEGAVVSDLGSVRTACAGASG